MDFVSQYGYSYDALSREPPSTCKEDAEIAAWREIDMRKVFLGRYSHRNLQKLYEDITTENNRGDMTFTNMVRVFTDRFKLSTNLTLANFKFRKICQEDSESFEAFTIRVKREARNCDFKCRDACTVIETMVRDQILFGTRDSEVRKAALKDQWKLDELLTKGRAIEASDQGAATIKQEPVESVKRTKPGKYSRKNMNQRKEKGSYNKKKGEYSNTKNRCKRCSSTRCDGDKKCPGRKVTCFECGVSGHFRGAEICKKKNTRRSRRVDEQSASSDATAENSSESESDLPGSSTDDYSDGEEPTRSKSNVQRVLATVSTIRRVGGRRYPDIRRMTSRYTTNVIIQETSVPVFLDTGADICILSKKNAVRLGLEILPTSMVIRPYGSRPKKCVGETTTTIMHQQNVANTKFYIMKQKVETLISGPVCEELGIITLNTENNPTVRRTEKMPKAKAAIMEKFPSIFSGVGSLRDHKVKFFVDKNIPAVYQPARPIPFHLKEKLDRELRKMELSPKDDGGLRVTLDMRMANRAIKKTNLPIPRPEEISSQLSGYEVYSKLDFKSAFHQLEIDEKSRRLTVFHANGRLMRYKRLTMGTAPASGELNKALRPLFSNIEHAHVIQDDLIIGGHTQQDHNKTLEAVCQKILESGMTLNPEKCIISTNKVPWWGMMISNKGVSPDPEKVEALKHMSPPKSRDEVKSLFCMLQSNRGFLPAMAEKTTNIRALLKKDEKFEWSSKCQAEFNQIRREFSSDICLHHFNPKLKTEIQVDAHKTGLAALLVQEDKGQKTIIGVASRATTPTESRYPQIDLEALAVDFGLRRFRFYVAGGPTVSVTTDHKPLVSIFKNLRKGSIRTERIKLRHQDIDYEVKWEAGIKNPADYLSRHVMPLKLMTDNIKEETTELEKTVWLLQYGPSSEH